jgi:hypothetical protein
MKPKSNVQNKSPIIPSKKRPAPIKKEKPLHIKKIKKERVTAAERRTSGRQKSAAKYIETGDSTDDDAMDVDDKSTEAEVEEEDEVASAA